MAEFTGDYKEYASNADSKYSIAFAEADLNCVKGVRFYRKGTTKKCGYETVDLSGKVAIEYTDYCYQHPFGELELDTKGYYKKVLDDPKKYLYPDPLYYDKGDPNPLCPTVAPSYSTADNSGKPRDDSKRIYMTGKEYAALGCCKVLEDLPVCLSVTPRVDVFPSIDAIGIPSTSDYYKKPDCPKPITYKGECREYEAKVFAGDKPAQAVTWSLIGNRGQNSTVSSTDPNGDVTYYKAQLCIADDETAEYVQVQACATFQTDICGTSTVRLKPRIILKVPEGVDGYSSCQTIDINAWIFGGGDHQELDVKITGGGTDVGSGAGQTKIIKTNDGKYQLQVSCNESNTSAPPLTITACDITGYNFVPALLPAGNGGCETIQLPKKWLSIEVGTNWDGINDSITQPGCGSCTVSGSPCGLTTTQQIRAIMNWSAPCERHENVTDDVAWGIAGATNPETAWWIVGRGASAYLVYRRGPNTYNDAYSFTDQCVTCSTVSVPTCTSFSTYSGNCTSYSYTSVSSCSTYSCTRTVPANTFLVEECEGNITLHATFGENIHASVTI